MNFCCKSNTGDSALVLLSRLDTVLNVARVTGAEGRKQYKHLHILTNVLSAFMAIGLEKDQPFLSYGK